MSIFGSFSQKGYKKLINVENYVLEDIYAIIPAQVFIYFPIPPTPLRQEEFNYISVKLLKTYKNSLGGKFEQNKFIIGYSTGLKVDLASTSIETVEIVKYIKERHEMDSFIKKYSLNDIRSFFENKPIYIDSILLKYNIHHLQYSKFGSLMSNYFYYLLEFRSSYINYIFSLLPKLNFKNLCQLSQEIEITKSQDFWEAYEEYWVDFGFDEHFNIWEYTRAFNYADSMDFELQNMKVKHFLLILLRLSKSDLLSKSSYAGVEGMYYFLSVADYAFQNSYHRKWVREGLKWYGQCKEIESFCKINGITYPIVC